jgi:hypothetical protein
MKYKLCEEVQEVYDCMITKLPMQWYIDLDKDIRKMKKSGDWDLLEGFFGYDVGCQHDALIDWKNPIKLLKLPRHQPR